MSSKFHHTEYFSPNTYYRGNAFIAKLETTFWRMERISEHVYYEKLSADVYDTERIENASYVTVLYHIDSINPWVYTCTLKGHGRIDYRNTDNA